MINQIEIINIVTGIIKVKKKNIYLKDVKKKFNLDTF